MQQDMMLNLMLIVTAAIILVRLRMSDKEDAEAVRKYQFKKIGLTVWYILFFIAAWYIAKGITLFFWNEFNNGANHFVWIYCLAGALIYLPGFAKEDEGKDRKQLLLFFDEVIRHIEFVVITALAFCTQDLGRLHISTVGIGILVLVVYSIAAIVHYYCCGKERPLDIRDIALLFLICCVFWYLGMAVYNDSTENITAYIPANLLVTFVPVLLVLFLTADLNLTISISVILNFVWTGVHYFVYQLRGSVLVPLDFLAAGTAATVAGQYDYSLYTEFWWLCMFSAAAIMLAGNSTRVRVKNRRKIFRLAGTGITCIAIILWYQSDFISNMNLPYYSGWWQKNMYDSVGYTLGFLETMKKSKVVPPDNYSDDYVKSLALQYQDSGEISEIKPNIIVIMNETLADIGDVGEIDTNMDYMPYYHSLKASENIAVGRTLVSTIGGGTSKSEYEFLTGNSQEFMPDGTPYTTEIYEDTWSIVTTLKNQGYYAVATHPNYGTNWKRNTVYKQLQFDEMHFIEDYEDAERMRGYVTDAEVYKKVMSWLENKGNDAPYFIFAVTMQNHGGYEVEPLREGEELPIVRSGVEEPEELDEYLSLIYESDKALEALIAAVDEFEEPTIVVMFGDHFPSFGNDVWSTIEASEAEESEGLAKEQIKYATPYIVYSNYDVDLREIPEYMSINYLGADVLEACGLQLTSYDNYLLEMQKVIPAVNFYGFLTEEGIWYSLDEDVPEDYRERISEYNILQYNARRGSKLAEMFSIEEK